MRIDIKPSARQHGIEGAEIRAVISYPELTLPLMPRRPGARPRFFTGPAAVNEPWIEIVADEIDVATLEVFHAMMLRPNLVHTLGIGRLIKPEYGPQRA